MSSEHRYKIPVFLCSDFERSLFEAVSNASPEEIRHLMVSGELCKRVLSSLEEHTFEAIPGLSGNALEFDHGSRRTLTLRITSPEKFGENSVIKSIYKNLPCNDEQRSLYLREILLHGYFFIQELAKSTNFLTSLYVSTSVNPVLSVQTVPDTPKPKTDNQVDYSAARTMLGGIF